MRLPCVLHDELFMCVHDMHVCPNLSSYSGYDKKPQPTGCGLPVACQLNFKCTWM